jgi:hypothetical protein
MSSGSSSTGMSGSTGPTSGSTRAPRTDRN